MLYHLPATAGGVAQVTAEKNLPHQTLQGVNDWNRTGYGGPCPPTGKHRYYFRLYALDIVLPDLGYPALEKAMRDHIAGQAELIGLYQRSS